MVAAVYSAVKFKFSCLKRGNTRKLFVKNSQHAG